MGWIKQEAVKSSNHGTWAVLLMISSSAPMTVDANEMRRGHHCEDASRLLIRTMLTERRYRAFQLLRPLQGFGDFFEAF